MAASKEPDVTVLCASTSECFIAGEDILSSFHLGFDLHLKCAAFVLVRMRGAGLAVRLLYTVTADPV